MAARALIAVAVLLSGCAKDTVVLLPGPDGKAGTVVVQRGQERHVLNQPYASSSVGQEVKVLPAAEVRESYGTVLQALPSRPAAFVLYFITGTDELTPASKGDLQKVLAELKQRPSPDVVAIGHTDTVGDLLGNDRLSLQRAERMKVYLVEIGIPGERIKTAGRGKRELLVPTRDNVDEPRNRRVEINVR